ncbi:hypothetical protein [Streptomyces collinus]
MTQPTDEAGKRRDGADERSLQITRAWTGLSVILLGDLAIWRSRSLRSGV